MANPSNNSQSNPHRSHQPNNTDDGGGDGDGNIFSRNTPMKLNKKRSLSLSFTAGAENSNSDDENINLSITCNLSPAQTARITEQFDHSLIACVIGRKITAQYLADRLRRVLFLTGTLIVTEIGRGYFVLKFSESSDCREAIKGRPWSIPNICISFFPWKPNFKPSEAVISDFDVWIRLPELSIEYYDREVLEQLAGTIGALVKIDPVTEKREKCKFARLCVNVNSSNPLPSVIELGQIRQEIEYEGLLFLCARCRRVDDLKQNCMNLSNVSADHRVFTYRHPSCRQDQPVVVVPAEPPPSGSRFQALGEELDEKPSLPMGECENETLVTSTSTSLPSVNVGLKFAQKKQNCLNSSNVSTENKVFTYRHPNCQQDHVVASSSKQPQVAVAVQEPPMSESRLRILGEERNEKSNLPMGECDSETVATSASSSLPCVNVGPKLAKKKLHVSGLKPEAASGFNLGKQKEISGESAQKVEASSKTITALKLKENNLIQSMPLAPSFVKIEFSDLKFTHQNDTLAAERSYQSLPVSIPYTSPHSPPPISEASLKFFSTAILHSTIEKEMSSTPSTEFTAKTCPIVYTFNPKTTNLEIGLSEATTSNQHIIHLAPTTRGGNEYGIGSGAKSGSCSNKLLCWNYRGTDSIKLKRALKDLIQLHLPSVVLIFGTKISGADADQVVKELDFRGSYCRKPDGYSGGIWMLLSRQDVQVEVNSYSPQQISASVQFETSSQPWGPSFFYSPSNLIDNTLAY